MKGDLNNIHPTHTCFDDALDMLQEAIKANPDSFTSDELKLVHAICLNPKGEEYSHAWIESTNSHAVNIVWFTGIYNGKRRQFAADPKEYYEEMKVKETTKYTPMQAWKMNEKFVTYGPWELKYQVLTKDA